MKCIMCNNPTNDPAGVCAVCKVMSKVNGEPLSVKQQPAMREKEKEKSCTIDGCERRYYAKGYCYPCYKKFIVRPKLQQKAITEASPIGKPIKKEEPPIVAVESKGANTGQTLGQLLYIARQIDKQLEVIIMGGTIDAQVIIDIKEGLRKCPIWRKYGEHELDKWHNKGDWDEMGWDGGCRFFEPAEEEI